MNGFFLTVLIFSEDDQSNCEKRESQADTIKIHELPRFRVTVKTLIQWTSSNLWTAKQLFFDF